MSSIHTRSLSGAFSTATVISANARVGSRFTYSGRASRCRRGTPARRRGRAASAPTASAGRRAYPAARRRRADRCLASSNWASSSLKNCAAWRRYSTARAGIGPQVRSAAGRCARSRRAPSSARPRTARADRRRDRCWRAPRRSCGRAGRPRRDRCRACRCRREMRAR